MGVYRPTWIAENDLVVEELENEADEIVIKPESEIEVKLKGEIPDDMADCLVSTRSCIAQAGGFFYMDSFDSNYIKGRLVNKCRHGLVFRRDDRIGRVYFVNHEDRLRADDLRRLRLVEGRESEDYRIGEDGTVELRVARKRIYVSKIGDLRVCSRSNFYSMTKTDNYDGCEDTSLFNLLETTVKVDIPDGVMGEIAEETGMDGIKHLPSKLIDPGSNWIVRLEVWGGRPEWVKVKFYRSELLKRVNVRETRETYIYCA